MDKKSAILRWQTEHQIPGKIQAMLTAKPDNTGDWCIRNAQHGKQMRLGILGPSEELDPPDVVTEIFEYLIQEHQYYMRKAMTQLWVRAAGKGTWALLLHSQIRGAGTGHAIKLFETFLKRNHPEVIAFHRVETRPWFPFRLDQPPKAMKFEVKPIIGQEILPLGDTGHFFHVLEWLPQLRHPYLELPAKILGALHPKPGDKLLEVHCGSGFMGISMASAFEKVVCIDARGISRQSVLHNLKARKITNVEYQQESLNQKWVEIFFTANTKGPWTVILNPTQGEALAPGVIKSLAMAPIGRLVLISSNLEVVQEEIRRFRRAGFLLRKIVPFDLNPTTNRIELVLFFAPDSAGVMKQGALEADERARMERVARITNTPIPEKAPRSSRKEKVEVKKPTSGLRFVQKKKSPVGRPRKQG